MSEDAPTTDKGDDLDSVRAAMVDAAAVSSGLWLSYLFALFYLLVAAGAVTHRDLLFETPVRLPFLGVDLPLKGFFWLGPTLFVIVHAYVLLHFVLLAGKIAAYDAKLRAQVADLELRTRLRRQLPSNIFIQFLAGPVEVRHGLVGLLLEVIAWISLVIGPVILLVFFQLQFLPYHEAWITWWQRIAVLVDVVLLWALWPDVVRETAPRDPDWWNKALAAWATWRRGRVAAFGHAMEWLFEPRPPASRDAAKAEGHDIRWSTALVLGCVTVVSLPMAFAIATFPGEWLNSLRYVPLRQALVEGDVDFSSGKRKSWWSDTLVLPGLDAIDRSRFDSDAKIMAARETALLRNRDFQGAVLIGAMLQKVDLSAANLRDAHLQRADLRGANLGCGNLPENHDPTEADLANPLSKCTQLQGSKLDAAQLQGAWLRGAQLQGASLQSAQLQSARLDYAQLQGASLNSAQLQGASLDFAQLQGASLFGAELQVALLVGAQLQGASLGFAELQGASLVGAQLQAASLVQAQLQAALLGYAQLQGASLRFAELQAAWLNSAQLQGASLDDAQLQGAWLDDAQLEGASMDRTSLNSASSIGARVWRASNRLADLQNARVTLTTVQGKSCTEPADQICGWSIIDEEKIEDLVRSEVPAGKLRDAALARIRSRLDPGKAVPDEQKWAEAWAARAKFPLTQAAYEAALAQQWAQIGCRAVAAPYVLHGLVRSIRSRFSRGSSELAALAAKFLDSGCAGANGLADADRSILQKLRDQPAPKLSSGAHQP